MPQPYDPDQEMARVKPGGASPRSDRAPNPTPAISTEGIILHRMPFGDTSVIVRWLTRDHGRITTMCKGARGPRSPMRQQIDLYYQCELQYRPSRRSDLHAASEVRVRHPFLGLRASYGHLMAAQYFSRLIELLSETDTALPADYELLRRAYEYLDTHPVTWRVVERFEQRLLTIHGLAPEGEGDITAALSAHHLEAPEERGKLRELVKAQTT